MYCVDSVESVLYLVRCTYTYIICLHCLSRLLSFMFPMGGRGGLTSNDGIEGVLDQEDPYLYYPFEIPNGTSYSCSSRTYSSYSLLGRNINASYEGPVLQFTGMQVGVM